MSTNEYPMILECPPNPIRVSKWNHHLHPSNTGTMQDQVAPNCPRCASSNTKFCYYNNYSLSQPRYFCKSCRRYWTKGGSLRNVPVGGGCRKTTRRTTTRPTPTQCVASASYDDVYNNDIDPMGPTSETQDGVVFLNCASQEDLGSGGSCSPGTCFPSYDNCALQDTWLEDGGAMLQHPITPLDMNNNGDDRLYEYMDSQDLSYQDYNNAFDQLQGILEADMVWSAGTGTDLASSRSTLDRQDLDMFSPDERLGLPENLLENWNPLDDQSVYEMFTGL